MPTLTKESALVQGIQFRVEKLINNLKLESWKIDENTGFLHISGVCARSGVMPYPNGSANIEMPFSLYRSNKVMEELAEILNKSGTPISFQHADIDSSNNYSMCGWVKKSGMSNGLVHFDAVVTQKEVIDQIIPPDHKENTKPQITGISVGYTPILKYKTGVWTDTEGLVGNPGESYHYQIEQVGYKKVNHIAIVGYGRGGEITKFFTDSFYDEYQEVLASFSDNNNGSLNTIQKLSELVKQSGLDSVEVRIEDSGSPNYPYPDKHINTLKTIVKKSKKKRRKKRMDDELKDALTGMIKDAIQDAMPGLQDAYTKNMESQYKQIEKGVKDLKDEFGSTVSNMVSAIKEMFESQDWKESMYKPVLDRIAASGPVMDSMDEDEKTKYAKAVQDAVQVWSEVGVELKDSIDDFSVSATELQKVYLEKQGFTLEDGATPESTAAAYAAFRAGQTKPTPKDETKQQTVTQKFFDTMNSVTKTPTSDGLDLTGVTLLESGAAVYPD